MTDLKNIHYIISDWDGTLVDSMDGYVEAFGQVMNQSFGIDLESAKKYYASVYSGGVLSQQIKDTVKKFTGESIVATIDLERKFFDYQKDFPPPAVINGARKTLQTLKGYKITIWSGTRTDILGIKLKQTGLDRFVDFYIGNEPGSITQVKGPALFAKIAKHFGIDPEVLKSQSLVIGDGEGDINAGKAVGCPTIGVIRTKTRKDFQSAGADFVITSIKDLPSLISK